MRNFLERNFSFRGRLARLPFFIRCIYVNIAAMLPLVLGLVLFTHDGRVWWWAGVAAVLFSLAVLGLGLASVFARRLHDLGLSGYHAIWIVAAEVLWTFLTNAPLPVILLALPLFAIDLWLTFWPGNAGANRFGEAPG
jgi:uncharacterized membrane protein YhaH (DUF805 family)